MSSTSSLTLKLPAFCPHKPFAKQAAFLLYDGLEALYGGAASGGKTDALLMGALQFIDVPTYAAILLRRSYTDLALPGALMDKAHEWLGKGSKTAIAHWDRETHTYTFKSGATLTFGYIGSSADRYRYQSAEFQYIGWDEITEFPEEEDYRFMFSRLRRLEGMDVPLRVRCASNPVGPGTHWVRKRFIDKDPPPVNAEGELDERQRVFIPATFKDNPHIDRETYALSLHQLHPALREALMAGSWDVILDAAFPEFREELHVIPNIATPQDWRGWEAMDWGVTNPTAWYRASLSPRGDIIVHGEFYRPGLISETSSAILTLRHNSWGNPVLAVCDPSITARTGFGQIGMGQTVHSEFGKNGIYLVSANNDRRAGFVRIGELLRCDPGRIFPDWHPRAGEFGAPRIFFTAGCKNLIEQIRVAPLDAVSMEVVDPYWETRRGHSVAALRYLVTARIAAPELPQRGREDRVIGDWSEWKDWKKDSWTEVG